MINEYRIVKQSISNAKVKNPYYVYKLTYVSADLTPTYKLAKQFNSEEDAKKYVAEKLDASVNK